MNLWILNNEFVQIGVIDDYTSLIWSKRYTELGDCEIYIAANERTIDLLQKGNYVVRDNDDMVCRIETVELDTNAETGDFLIATGQDCRSILNQRIIREANTYKGRAEALIRQIVNGNIINPATTQRKIQRVRLGADNGFTETLDVQVAWENVFDKIKEVCTTYGYGSRMTFDGTNFTFNIYKGVDRSIDQDDNEIVIFSPEFDNLISSKYKVDSSTRRNTALIVGEGEKALYAVKEEINPAVSDLERYELYVDGSDISATIKYEDLIAAYPNGTIVERNAVVYYVVSGHDVAILNHITTPTEGQLLDQYYSTLLTQRGKERLAEAVETVTFEGEVEPFYSYKYGEDYFLGDIVTVKNEYGVEANARIIEVIEKDDENGYSIIPTFQYMEVEEQPIVITALLTEESDPILTEDGDVLEIEEAPTLFASSPSQPSSPSLYGSKKISELPESTDVYDGCCIPIVTNGETRKIYYSLLKQKLSQDLEIDAISSEQIDAICV